MRSETLLATVVSPPVLGDTSSIYHAAASSKGTEINCNSVFSLVAQLKTKTVQRKLKSTV